MCLKAVILPWPIQWHRWDLNWRFSQQSGCLRPNRPFPLPRTWVFASCREPSSYNLEVLLSSQATCFAMTSPHRMSSACLIGLCLLPVPLDHVCWRCWTSDTQTLARPQGHDSLLRLGMPTELSRNGSPTKGACISVHSPHSHLCKTQIPPHCPLVEILL